MDATRDFGFYGDANLQEYLRRPVKISDQAWTVTSGSLNYTLDPWSLFLEDTNVRNRIEGYRLLQGTMHLRIAINGGPFFYGRAIAAYEPRHNDNDHSFGAANSEFYTAQLSLLPHVYLDPTTSEGGELVPPFFNPDNWIDLIGDSYRDMGQLRIQSMNDLLHANASTGTVNISVYAWMENVRLAAPTTATYNTYVAQSGEIIYPVAGATLLGTLAVAMKYFKSTCSYAQQDGDSDEAVMEPQAGDEYGTGVVSKPASTVAKVAGWLTGVPAIKPYARATEIAASTVGRMAHVFGFSRPTLINNIERVKNKAGGNLANTDQHEAVAKLALDSKQELSVDPRTVGLSNVDEMSFDYIKQKEMYVTTVNWSESDGGGTSLGVFSVGPDYALPTTLSTLTHHQVAPMYGLALPFQNWRGSIKYRFQLAASQLHRGRLRITYDPYQAGVSGENQVYSRIVDLSTNRDFEMVVSWNHARPWLRVQNRLGSATIGSHPGMTTVSMSPLFHNGQIRIEVVNELTSPDPALSQPVYINCFVSAAEDFELANPTDEVLNLLEFEPQSGEVFEPQSGEEGEEVIDEADDIPESPTGITPIGEQEALDAPHNHVFFGETFKSVRSMLKRYCYHQAITADGVSGAIYSYESNFPVEPGQSVAPRHETGAAATPASTPYNYTSMTYLNYFTPAFVGWRGGLRSKYFWPYDNSTNSNPFLMIRRSPVPINQADCGAIGHAAITNHSTWNALIQSRFKVGAGHDVTYSAIDGAVEVEFPFYSEKRFAPARSFLDGSNGSSEDYKGNDFGHLFYMMTGTTQTIPRFVAAGDDFSLFFFIGWPPLLFRQKPDSGVTIADGPI